jgi:hypothetical protein
MEKKRDRERAPLSLQTSVQGRIFRPFFFSGEGPRSRRYGRTTALRLIVQPYDEDDDDYYFFSFS